MPSPGRLVVRAELEEMDSSRIRSWQQNASCGRRGNSYRASMAFHSRDTGDQAAQRQRTKSQQPRCPSCQATLSISQESTQTVEMSLPRTPPSNLISNAWNCDGAPTCTQPCRSCSFSRASTNHQSPSPTLSGRSVKAQSYPRLDLGYMTTLTPSQPWAYAVGLRYHSTR